MRMISGRCWFDMQCDMQWPTLWHQHPEKALLN
jgi:hypothetical protein